MVLSRNQPGRDPHPPPGGPVVVAPDLVVLERTWAAVDAARDAVRSAGLEDTVSVHHIDAGDWVLAWLRTGSARADHTAGRLTLEPSTPRPPSLRR